MEQPRTDHATHSSSTAPLQLTATAQPSQPSMLGSTCNTHTCTHMHTHLCTHTHTLTHTHTHTHTHTQEGKAVKAGKAGKAGKARAGKGRQGQGRAHHTQRARRAELHAGPSLLSIGACHHVPPLAWGLLAMKGS